MTGNMGSALILTSDINNTQDKFFGAPDWSVAGFIIVLYKTVSLTDKVTFWNTKKLASLLLII